MYNTFALHHHHHMKAECLQLQLACRLAKTDQISQFGDNCKQTKSLMPQQNQLRCRTAGCMR